MISRNMGSNWKAVGNGLKFPLGTAGPVRGRHQVHGGRHPEDVVQVGPVEGPEGNCWEIDQSLVQSW